MTNHRLDTGTDELLGEVRDGVAIFTLNRPAARNALSDHLTPALRAGIATCDADPTRRLPDHRRGQAFCAGGDEEHGCIVGRIVAARWTQGWLNSSNSSGRSPAPGSRAVRKPSVAALPGPAAGPGCHWRWRAVWTRAAGHASAYVRTA